jgi:hypothetical protein
MRRMASGVHRRVGLTAGVLLIACLAAGPAAEDGVAPPAPERSGRAAFSFQDQCRSVATEELGRFVLTSVTFSRGKDDGQLRKDDLQLLMEGVLWNRSSRRLRFRPPELWLSSVRFWAVGDQTAYRVRLAPGVRFNFDQSLVYEVEPGGKKALALGFSVWERSRRDPLTLFQGLLFEKVRTDGLAESEPEYVGQLPPGMYGVSCELQLGLLLTDEDEFGEIVNFPISNILWINIPDQTGQSVPVSTRPAGEAQTRPSP